MSCARSKSIMCAIAVSPVTCASTGGARNRGYSLIFCVCGQLTGWSARLGTVVIAALADSIGCTQARPWALDIALRRAIVDPRGYMHDMAQAAQSAEEQNFPLRTCRRCSERMLFKSCSICVGCAFGLIDWSLRFRLGPMARIERDSSNPCRKRLFKIKQTSLQLLLSQLLLPKLCRCTG